MDEDKKKKIRETLDKYLADYIPMQEIIHVCDQLTKAKEEDRKKTVHKMMDYLMQPDKEFVYLQTVNTKSITNNHVRLCMADVTKIFDGGTV